MASNDFMSGLVGAVGRMGDALVGFGDAMGQINEIGEVVGTYVADRTAGTAGSGWVTIGGQTGDPVPGAGTQISGWRLTVRESPFVPPDAFYLMPGGILAAPGGIDKALRSPASAPERAIRIRDDDDDD